MNVSLTPELEQFVADKVKSGRYTSASEVVREALRLLEEREELRSLQKQELQKKIAEGLDQLARGEGLPGEAVFAELDAELDALEQTPDIQ
jgi:antitoxin ParD1/3/4